MTVYVCGDSFGCRDPEYGPSWTDMLCDKLSGNLVNLSRVCASNMQIGLQIDRAIEQNASFIIYLATSSVRDDVLFSSAINNASLIDRFVDITAPDKTKDLTSYSVQSLDDTTLFDSNQLLMLKQYHSTFFDLDIAIYRNQLIIEGNLSRLQHSNIPFVFDQGGFEHPSFSNSKQDYFQNYKQYKSQLCVWDHVDRQLSHRPYYHISDATVNNQIADYYYKLINDKT
jgi:hypothetical protein